MKLASKLVALTALVAVFAVPSLAQAQKIATANMQRILNELKETKELETKLKSKFEDAQRSQQAAQQKYKELQAQRDVFKPGSPEYDRANKDLVNVAIEAQVTGQLIQQELVREQKRQLKLISEKIVASVKTLAEQKQISVVFAQVIPPDVSEENWEKLTVEQVSNLLASRNILYVAPDTDLTTEVITALDAAHAAGQ